MDRRIRFSALFLSTVLYFCVAVRGSTDWQPRAEIPHVVYGHGAAAIDATLYIIGGCETADWTRTSKRVQIYDLNADVWREGPALPAEIGWPMVAVHAGRIYVFGGMQSGAISTDRAWCYDPAAAVWSALPPMPARVMNGVAIAAGDSIYLGLGYERTDGSAKGVVANFTRFYRYDPVAGTYTRLADAPEGACYAAVGLYEGRIYVVHGATFEVGFHDMKDYGWAGGALKYQLTTNTWTKINSPRIEPRIFFLTQCSSSAFHNEKLFVVGGQSHYQRTTTTSFFNMKDERFYPIPALPRPRCCGGGGVVAGHLTIAGGFWGVGETGDPASPTWVLPVE